MADDATDDPSTLPIGTVLDGRYRLEALLGEGGIGQVFEATHLALGTAVAVKVLRPELADTELLRKRFEREARALTELSHPHIVAVTDVGVSDGTPYLVMEKVEGRPLSSVLRAGPLDPPRALELTRQILRAVGHAHERGLVHRDLKPGNILLREVDGRDHAVVLDFGLARYTGERGRQGTALTRRGSLIGTPAYMAPEQAAGGQVDERADVYAIGLVAYEMLTGRRPFLERDAPDLLRAHLVEPAPALEAASEGLEVSEELEEWTQRALAKDRADRFRDARVMLAALDALPAEQARRWASAPARPDDPPTPPDPTAETLPAGARPPAVVAPPSALPLTREAVIEATRDSAAAAPPAPPRRPATSASMLIAIAAVIGVGALLALAAGGAILALVLRSPDAPPPAPPAVIPRPAPAPPEGGRLLAPPVMAVDPMASLPAELVPARHRLAAGRRLDQTTRVVLARYNRDHPQDARGHLLLGRHFTESRSLSYALPEYERALELDPEGRRWAPVLPDLLEHARSERYHAAAVDLIASRYGAEALPAARAERERLRRPAEQRRIDALIERIEGR
ncbi:MAG: serine/threonine protein kinase [Sandaracinaceae bacterium]|nr:serine/threonine protein kinase [Sandaracinaceae bacterium]